MKNGNKEKKKNKVFVKMEQLYNIVPGKKIPLKAAHTIWYKY